MSKDKVALVGTDHPGVVVPGFLSVYTPAVLVAAAALGLFEP